jgi:hypothetical protein
MRFVQGWRRVLWAALPLLACGCNLAGGLVGTEVKVTGSGPSLEEQVLGSYEEIGEEVYLLAGVRAIDPSTGAPTAPPPMTRSEERALAARRRIEFNRDDVQEFKRLGYAGEGSDGMLVPFEASMERLRAQDERRFRLVGDIVREENEDRLVIMERIVDTTPELAGQEGLATVRRILAARYRQEAEPGTMFQLPGGDWTVKEAQ